MPNDPTRIHQRELTEPQQKAMLAVKEAGATFLSTLDGFCHPNRETSIARTKIEEAVMWAVKGITA